MYIDWSKYWPDSYKFAVSLWLYTCSSIHPIDGAEWQVVSYMLNSTLESGKDVIIYPEKVESRVVER